PRCGLLQEVVCRRPPQRRAADRRRKAKQLERRSRPRTAEPTATGFGEQPPRSPSTLLNGAQRAVVFELYLPFVLAPALGIKCAIFRLNPLKALGGFRDGSSNGEIIRLAFDYKPVSPSWEYKVFILWLNH